MSLFLGWLFGCSHISRKSAREAPEERLANVEVSDGKVCMSCTQTHCVKVKMNKQSVDSMRENVNYSIVAQLMISLLIFTASCLFLITKCQMSIRRKGISAGINKSYEYGSSRIHLMSCIITRLEQQEWKDDIGNTLRKFLFFAMLSGREVKSFQKNLLPPSSSKKVSHARKLPTVTRKGKKKLTCVI
jgi:hypothetical protein